MEQVVADPATFMESSCEPPEYDQAPSVQLASHLLRWSEVFIVSITAISSSNALATNPGLQIERTAARAADNASVEISFEPASRSSTPMSKLSNGVIDTLRNFEQTRADNRLAMQNAGAGPASSMSVAKDEMLSGPASIRPSGSSMSAEEAAKPVSTTDAVSAMTRSFDYAIETQLIVKTGSQFSTSASSLMRGQ